MADRREQDEQREKQIHELQTQISFLEEEVGLLRRRLTNAPRQVQLLEEKLVETREGLARATGQNQKLADALRDEKQRIESLAEEVEKLSQPPATFGVFIGEQRRRLRRRRHGGSEDARDAGAGPRYGVKAGRVNETSAVNSTTLAAPPAAGRRLILPSAV